MKRIVITAGSVLLLSVAGGGIALASGGSGAATPADEQQQEAAYTAAHRADATVSEDDAIATALAAHPGTATDVHLETEENGLVWEVKPDDGTQLWEVQVDASTGEVVSDQLDD